MHGMTDIKSAVAFGLTTVYQDGEKPLAFIFYFLVSHKVILSPRQLSKFWNNCFKSQPIEWLYSIYTVGYVEVISS